ncbi:MAG: deoxyribonuclease IV [Actinobacteria bacterium]|nr:deoxyribonuclease IV [Actinomycetota bacterium]
MTVGAHVPTRGSLMGAIDSAHACGAAAAQIWGSNPRAWAHPNVPEASVKAFRSAWAAASIGPLFLHAPYMVNIASPNDGFRQRSVDLARATVELAEGSGAAGIVVHAGAAGAGTARATGLRRAAGSLLAIAGEADRTIVLVELTAGTAGAVASTLPEARELLDAAEGEERIRLCIDTCHLFAAGYPLDEPDGVAASFAELRSTGLEERLGLVHANDSAFPRGQRRDGHTHIGAGHIGEAGFAAILAQPPVRGVPVVCETPGRLEDAARNIETLRRLADGSRRRPVRRTTAC